MDAMVPLHGGTSRKRLDNTRKTLRLDVAKVRERQHTGNQPVSGAMPVTVGDAAMRYLFIPVFLLLVPSRSYSQSDAPASERFAPANRSTAHATVVADPRTFTEVTVGAAHVCGLSSDGRVWCWGASNAGQTGAANRTAVAAPQLIDAGERRYVTVTAGAMHTCAVTSSARAECWGLAESGQLGSTRTPDDCVVFSCLSSPATVETGVRFETLAAGHAHTCAVADGRAWCWGKDDRGQLGIGMSGPSCRQSVCPLPTRIPDLPSVTAVVAGGGHSCALAATGEAWCWGDN